MQDTSAEMTTTARMYSIHGNIRNNNNSINVQWGQKVTDAKATAGQRREQEFFCVSDSHNWLRSTRDVKNADSQIPLEIGNCNVLSSYSDSHFQSDLGTT